jgi:IS1 family transposase
MDQNVWIWIAVAVVAITAIYFVWGRKLGSKQEAPAKPN